MKEFKGKMNEIHVFRCEQQLVVGKGWLYLKVCCLWSLFIIRGDVYVKILQ